MPKRPGGPGTQSETLQQKLYSRALSQEEAGLKLAAVPPGTPRHNGSTNPAPADFKAREHVVQSGEFLSTILEAYNAAFKAEGLSGRVTQSQVLKANPGLDPNRLLVRQKLLIPLPGEIK